MRYCRWQLESKTAFERLWEVSRRWRVVDGNHAFGWWCVSIGYGPLRFKAPGRHYHGSLHIRVFDDCLAPVLTREGDL